MIVFVAILAVSTVIGIAAVVVVVAVTAASFLYSSCSGT